MISFADYSLHVAKLFSTVFNRGATSAIATLALWLFVFFFLGMIAQGIAGSIAPINDNSTIEQVAQYETIYRNISRISPSNLYGEAVQVVLMPDLGDASATMMLISTYTSGLVPGVLPLYQSLLIVWPQIILLLALSALCFAGSYIKFMREEIRST